MRLEIISAEKVLFKGNVQRVTLPGSLGTFTILEQHAPLDFHTHAWKCGL